MANVQIQLDANDLGQVIDGLEVLASQWEATARYHGSGDIEIDDYVHEASDFDEAEYMANTYSRLIESLRSQLISSRVC